MDEQLVIPELSREGAREGGKIQAVHQGGRCQ